MANVDKAKEIDPLVSALNLIMQRQAAQLGFRFGKNRYFFDDDHKQLLGPRLLALMGFYSSVRPVYKQLMVNVNVCMAPFHEPGKLSNALCAFDVRSRGASPNLMAKVKVSSRYRGYKYVKPIFRVLDTSARKTTFPCEEYGGNITVEKFFQKSALRLHFNQLHVLTLGQRVRNSTAGSRHITCYRHWEGRQASLCASRTL